MNTDIIDDPYILCDSLFQKEKNVNITAYIKDQCSIKVPKSLVTNTIKLDTDNEGYIDPNNEQMDPSLMGTMIDYLIRFTICHDFAMADTLEDYDIETLFNNVNINHLTNKQIESAFEFAKREQLMRSDDINVYEQKLILSNTLKKHISIMLNRCKHFFERYGYPNITGFHAFISKSETPLESLQSLYQKPIAKLHTLIKGDGDYLLPTALVDLKVSKYKTQSAAWKKQLIVYYLGLNKNELKQYHMTHDNIQYLINFNPRYDTVYQINIYPKNIKDWTSISAAINMDLDHMDESLQGYVHSLKNGLNERALVTEMQAERFTDKFIKYSDGIHKITKSEYPVKWPGQVYLVKHDGAYMFFIKHTTRKTKNRPSKEVLNILNGKRRKHATHDLQYYYDNLPSFVSILTNAFSKYQNALDKLTGEIMLIEQIPIRYDSSINHGSIINVGPFERIYLDPMSGFPKYYRAPSMSERVSYDSLHDLLADSIQFGSFEEHTFNNYLKLSDKSYLKQYDHNTLKLNMPKQTSIILKDMDTLSNIKVKSTYEPNYDNIMYSRSRIMSQIQKILNYNIVTFWNDAVIKHSHSIDSINTNELTSNEYKLTSNEYQLITKTISKPFKQLTKIPQKSILILPKHIDQKYVKKINQIQHKRTKLRQLHYSKVIAISKSIRIKNHHWLQHIDLNLIKSILLDTINITNQMEWNKTLERYRHSLKGSEISVLNEFHKKLIPLIKQIGKPDQINLFIKDKNKKVIGYADLQINNQLILLELIKDTKINTYMLNNLNKLKLQSNKSIVLYKMALGKLFIFEH